MALSSTSLQAHSALRKRVEDALSLIDEHATIEFKEGQSWDTLKPKLVRTALAMANLEDGGLIIVGVSERESPRRVSGVSPEQLNTFDADQIKQAIDAVASSPLRLDTAEHEHKGTKLVVIRVFPFDSLPIVCQRDGTGYNRGQVLFRPSIGNPRTEVISNERDMLDLIERAAFKKMSQLNRLRERFQALNADDYASTFFRDAAFSTPWYSSSLAFDGPPREALTSSAMQQWIGQHAVRISGWPFPYWPSNDAQVFVSGDEVGWPLELATQEHDRWRIRFDGHVVRASADNAATNQEYQDVVRPRFPFNDTPEFKQLKGFIDFDVLVRNFVEPIELAARALRTGLFKGDVTIRIGIEQAKMWALGSRRRDLLYAHFFRVEHLMIEHRVSQIELLESSVPVASRFLKQALEAALLRIDAQVLETAVKDRLLGKW